MRPESRIAFHGSTVTKAFGADIKAEYEKSLRLWEVGQRFGFLSPRPLVLNEAQGSIEFSFIPDSRSIRGDYLAFMKARVAEPKCRKVFVRAGEVLAIIHRELVVPSPEPWRPNAQFCQAAQEVGCDDIETVSDRLPHVVLHGDYGPENVESVNVAGQLKLAVFDASPNYFITFSPSAVGPIYIDIGNFISVLCGLVPLRHYPLMNWKRALDLQAAFIEGYRREATIDCDVRLARIFAYATASCYLQYKFPNPYLHKLAMWLLFGHDAGRTLGGVESIEQHV